MPRSSSEQKGLPIIHLRFCLGLPQVTVVRKQPRGGIWSMPWVRKFPWRRDSLPTSVFLDFPGGSAGKESTCKAGDLGSIPGLGRYPREGNGYPLQYSGLENSMDCIVHGVVKSQTQLSKFHFHFTLRPQVCSCQLPADIVLRTAGGVLESDTVQKI